jgi:hypothetical protein
MDRAKRARTAVPPKQPSLGLQLRAPYLYPDRRHGLQPGTILVREWDGKPQRITVLDHYDDGGYSNPVTDLLRIVIVRDAALGLE